MDKKDSALRIWSPRLAAADNGIKTFGSMIVRKRYGVDIDNNITDGNATTIKVVDNNDKMISYISWFFDVNYQYSIY